MSGNSSSSSSSSSNDDDDVPRSTFNTTNIGSNEEDVAQVQQETMILPQTISSITNTTLISDDVPADRGEHCRPMPVDEHVCGTTAITNSDITTVSPSTKEEEVPILDFTDLLKEADEQLQQLIGAIALQEGGDVVQDSAEQFNKINNTSALSRIEDKEYWNADRKINEVEESTSWDNIGVSSSTSTPLMSNVPACVGITSDDENTNHQGFKTTLLKTPLESKPKDKQDSNPNNHSKSEMVQTKERKEEDDENTAASTTPEKSFLWYYPKSLFITATTATTMTNSHEPIESNDHNNKKWWWNTTSGTTNTSNHDISSSSRAYPQDASIVDRSLLRKKLQTALDQQQQQLLLQQPRNPTMSTHDNPSKLLVVRNSTTGCTAIQLGEETFRITISIPEITISQVIHYISNPNTLSSWCNAVITSTTYTANPASTTRHHLLTTTTIASTNIKEDALSLSSSEQQQQQQQRFDAEWFESTVTLRIPTLWCSCYNLWTQLMKLSPNITHESSSSSSRLTLFVDHRRSRISITYILAGCEVNHTFTFTTTTTTATAATVTYPQHQRRLVHIKDTLRVIPLGSSRTNNCYRCIRPLLRKYVLPNIQSHMKQAMISLENLQSVFTKGSEEPNNTHIATTTTTPNKGDDLTTPLLSSI